MKVKDLCSFGRKSTIKAGEGKTKGNFVFYTSSNVINKFLDDYQFNDEGIIMGTGGNATLHYSKGKFSVSTDCIVLKCFDGINCKFLFYYFKNNINVLELGFKGAGLKHTSKKYIQEIEISYLPSLECQNKIVQILDAAQSLIDKRKEQIEACDELIKSQFVEMFGNEKYQMVKAQDICDFITKGTTPKTDEIVDEYAEGFVPYLKVYNLSFDGQMLFDVKRQFIANEIHQGVLARSKVYPNDVLMNIVGPPLGKFILVPETYQEWNINQAIAIFRATDKVIPRFLLYALMQPEVLQPFIDSAVGIRQQNLSLEQCRNLEIPLPPFDLQNQFATIAQQVDKLKFAMHQSLTELENSFNALMQKAFKGELFSDD